MSNVNGQAKSKTQSRNGLPAPKEGECVGMPIGEIIERLRKDAERSLAREIRAVETTQLARCILSEFDWLEIEPVRSHYGAGYLYLTVDGSGMSLKTQKRDLNQKIVKMCRALRCPLKYTGRCYNEERPKEMQHTLIPRDFPNVYIRYYTPLPRGKQAKCKIVTVKPKPYKTLQCEK